MKKSLKALGFSALMLVCGLTATAQIQREGNAPERAFAKTAGQPCVKIAPDMMPRTRANEASQKTNNIFPELQATVKAPRTLTANYYNPAPAKAAPKATGLQGYCTYNGTVGTTGWGTLNADLSISFVWEHNTQFSPSTGFVRGDQVYSFYVYGKVYDNEYYVTDAGYYIQNLSDGTVTSQVTASIFDSLEEVVYAAAYDSTEDVAYVITANAAGTSYMLQKFNPKNGQFTNLGVNMSSDWLNLGWNPADNSLYMFDTNGLLKKYDSKAKRFNQTNSLPYEIDDYTQCMIYSPKDNGFIMPVDVYTEADGEFTGLFVMPTTGNYTYLGKLPNGPQYAMLYVKDAYVNANGPKAPALKSWNVAAGATQGNFVVTLPSQLENGKAITGKVYLEVTVDGNAVSGSFSGNAGADVTIPVSTDEGMHHFSVVPYVLSDDGKVLGSALLFDRALGADVPKAPANVVLTETRVSWNAVTEGANGGAIDAANVTYNVYVDKVLMTPEPVKATSLDITIPPTGVVAHRAEVYAICDGKTSAPGISGKLYVDGALSLPVYLGPEEGQKDLDPEVIAMFTPVKDILNNESMRGWRYDDQSEHTGGFYCLYPTSSSTGDTGNEWLFLPAINFTDKDAHYRFTMEVWTGYHYFTADETYEVALCQRPNGSRPTIIREASTVYKNPAFELSETIFQVPEAGEWYIGIHYISPLGNYRLYARNFMVEVAKSSSDSPAAVTDITAVAGARGELAATLSFKMPTLSISGTELDAATVITAEAVSEAGSASVTGKPGETVSVKVPAIQGSNIIRVTTSSDKGQGQIAETTVYCGIYRPATPYVFTSVTDDNMKLTLEIDLDDYNADGEFTGPDLTDVIIYRRINDEWRPVADLGKNRTWEFTAPDASKQDMYMFGAVSKNAVGTCEEMNSFMIHLGKLYTLPLVETFPTSGQAVDFKEPLSIEHLSYLQSTWGFVDPRDMDEDAANSTANALACTWDGESQLLLPRFTTTGMNNVKLNLGLYTGNLAPSLVTVYATSPVMEMEPVAQFASESGRGPWENKLISLPAMCQNQPWVQLTIRVKITGYSECFMLESYSVADYPDDMMTISSFSGPGRGAVGETLTYSVEIENAGTATQPMPQYTFKATGNNGIIADLKDSNAPATIAAGKKVTLSFDVTPKAADKGDMLVTFNLEGQPSESVSKVEKEVVVLNAPIPVVNDLTYSLSGSDVTLSWTEPKFTESFEAIDAWEMGATLKGFRNIDLDEGKEWGITEVSYPGKGSAKAFQVFDTSITDSPLFAAHTGTQYLLCISASKVESDDWLISPEVVPGSTMSFWMNIFSDEYPETVLVMYSTTGNDPADFKQMLDGGYVCPDETGWTKFEFTLPANARYFALHHVTDDPEAAFGFMIDDIAYTAAQPAVTLDGYNVYRDGEAASDMLTAPGFTDKGVDTSVPVRYYVMSVGTVNGETVESDRSNVIWIDDDESGIEDVTADSRAAIVVDGKTIVLKGFTAGNAYTVSATSGIVIAAGETTGDDISINVSAGIYIVKCGNVVAKVAVR